MFFEQEYLVGIQDVGAGSVLSDRAFLEAFNNTSNMHSIRAHQSTIDQQESHIAWFIMNWKLQVFQRPQLYETFRVRTWAQQHSRALANRDFKAFNAAGETIAMATSVWVAVNPETGTILRMTPEMMKGYEPEPETQNFPGHRFSRTVPDGLPVIAEKTFSIPKSMIDGNHHVHNTAYLDLAAEVLPAGLDEMLFGQVEVRYRQEILPGGTVKLSCCRENERYHVLIRNAADDALHAVVTLWD